MMQRLLTAGFAALALSALVGCAEPPPPAKPFGDPMKLPESESITVETVLASPEEHDGKYVRMSGTVTDVCSTRGCWMEVGSDDGEDAVFVKFTCPIDGRLIPMEAVGQRAEVEGTLEFVQISESEAQHYAEESKNPEQAAKIEGPQKQVKMAAPAARIEGIEIQSPQG